MTRPLLAELLRRRSLCVGIVLILFGRSVTCAQERQICEPDGETCTPDSLYFCIEGPETATIESGEELVVWVTVDVLSRRIYGWVYGVEYDPEALDFLGVSLARDVPATFINETGTSLIPSAGFLSNVVLAIFPPTGRAPVALLRRGKTSLEPSTGPKCRAVRHHSHPASRRNRRQEAHPKTCDTASGSRQ